MSLPCDPRTGTSERVVPNSETPGGVVSTPVIATDLEWYDNLITYLSR